MRFTYLELENYIGIYNGMGLNSIQIDLSRCLHRTLIIRGENGSGKSTIFKAMNVFPDGNESFIPGMPAKKIICLQDNDVLYTIKFFHGVTSSGNRETTKAYISKMINGVDIELNENGNVSSFKDVLYGELSLDPNFAALSQLSNDDKGLADKKPAERKKFVNAIIESLEVYNDIYKAISKKSGNIKAMMESLVTKLGNIGNMDQLETSLKSIIKQINDLAEQKDLATKELMKYDATVNILDPGGVIQTEYGNAALEKAQADNELKTLLKSHPMNMVAGPEYAMQYHMENYKILEEARDETTKKIKELEEKLKTIYETLQDLSNQLREKESMLTSLTDEDGYQKAMDGMILYKAEVETYRQELSITGINIDQFTKDEYVLALETIKDIKKSVDTFRDLFDYETIEESVRRYQSLDWPSMVPLIDTSSIQSTLDNSYCLIGDYTDKLVMANMDMETIKNLSNRPKGCKDDSCYFIANLLKIEKTKPAERIKEYSKLLKEENANYEKIKSELQQANQLNACMNQIRIIIREIDKNGSILSRLPNGVLFSSKAAFFQQLLTGDDFSYMEKLYQYIDYANTVELYHISLNLYNEYSQKCDLYASKADVLESLEREISNIKKKQSEYTDSSSQVSQTKRYTEKNLSDIMTELAKLDVEAPILQAMVNAVNKIRSCDERVVKLQSNIQKINELQGHMKYVSDRIVDLTNQIAPLMNQRDEINFNIQQAQTYAKELEQLRAEYERVEIIKKYSSPTKGIQLVFMELYMGKILTLANELLSFLFSGEYSIQPFIINETEFRIPCLGGGYINDDISSMSSSQLTMISMIISFALLHTSSTKYNIIKMDEIDGPLDENNRMIFIDVMNRIMNIMNVEQCIMISHNAELQVDSSDVILLKSSQLSEEYLRGNIIWKY